MNNETMEQSKHIGEGLAWMGFWIGLGLYNFQGCTPQIDEAVKIHKEINKEGISERTRDFRKHNH